MWEDPIVAEVRRVQREIEEECGNDFTEIFRRATELQKQFTDRLVSDPVHSQEDENQQSSYSLEEQKETVSNS